MKRILSLLPLVLLIACNSGTVPPKETTTKVVHDTVRLIERIIDTVYIDKSANEYHSYSTFYIRERLPEWLLEMDIIQDLKLQDKYKIDARLNPFYLEADFNGDGNLDIAFSIKEINSTKVGFAIIHSSTKEIHIIGAGMEIKNSFSDDMNYIDIWKVNRLQINKAGLEENTGTGSEGELILKTPSLQIEKSEVGGGLIYWNGKEYAYFHQTC
jgi:hypothetical protein